MKTVINIKTDKDIKELAQKTAGDLGLSLSALINAYLRQFVRTKEAYFTLSPRMSPALENLLGKMKLIFKGIKIFPTDFLLQWKRKSICLLSKMRLCLKHFCIFIRILRDNTRN